MIGRSGLSAMATLRAASPRNLKAAGSERLEQECVDAQEPEKVV
jgi:hypothetical protein